MIESLIYLYIIICTSLILFNIGYVLLKSIKKSLLEYHSTKFKKLFENEVARFKGNNEVSDEYKEYLYSKLKRPNALIVFQNKIEDLKISDVQLSEEFSKKFMPTIFKLKDVYSKKNSKEKAYFAYVLTTFDYIKEKPSKKLMETLIEFLGDKSIYVHINTMECIYKIGNIQYVIKAIKIMDLKENFYNTKLLTEGLLTFSENKSHIDIELWKVFKSLSPKTQIAIIDYYRLSGSNFKEELLGLLKSNETDLDVKCSIIRYYTKYPYDNILGVLLDHIKDTNEYSWVIKSLAIGALIHYESNNCKEILKIELTSDNWFIRNNSAKVLVQWGLSKEDVIEVFQKDDKFAKETLTYYLKQQDGYGGLIESLNLLESDTGAKDEYIRKYINSEGA